MSQIWPEKYHYKVCPHCKSKRLTRIFVREMGRDTYFEPASTLYPVNHTKCRNCNRIFWYTNAKWIYDYAEMRRDIKGLERFLEGKSKDGKK